MGVGKQAASRKCFISGFPVDQQVLLCSLL